MANETGPIHARMTAKKIFLGRNNDAVFISSGGGGGGIGDNFFLATEDFISSFFQAGTYGVDL